MSIRFDNFEKANEHVWHILDVQKHSPAALAGLQAFGDYIIGGDTVMNDCDDFFMLVESHQGKALKFYVYNSESDTTREVTLTPNSQWGGEGCLGCGIGYGYLHRIPLHRGTSKPITKPNPLLLNSDKSTLLSSMAPPNINFTFQPGNLPPLTISMPPLILPIPVNNFGDDLGEIPSMKPVESQSSDSAMTKYTNC